MRVMSELGTVIKRILLVSDELGRLSSEVKELSRDVNNHEVRLAVIENTLSLTSRSSKIILPGK